MSLSRSAITVTRAASAPIRPAARAPRSQRALSLASKGVTRSAASISAWAAAIRGRGACSSSSASSRPSTAPSSASTPKTAWRKRPVPRRAPCRTTLVSWIANTCRPTHREAVRPAASRTISPVVTAGLRRNRVTRISPARSPPRRRTRSPRAPTSTSRPRRKAPLFAGDGRQTAPAPMPTPLPVPSQINARNQTINDPSIDLCECRRAKRRSGTHDHRLCRGGAIRANLPAALPWIPGPPSAPREDRCGQRRNLRKDRP